jgi:hypothetical protein
MIEKLTIKNFKSIKELDIDCRRINLFIGEPNTGKSNILEALGLLSWMGHLHIKDDSRLNQYLRFEEVQNLFFDGLLDEKIGVNIKRQQQSSTEIAFDNINFEIKNKITENDGKQDEFSFLLDYSGDIKKIPERVRTVSGREIRYVIPIHPDNSRKFFFIKYYKFLKQNNFPDSFPGCLLPPHGSNMFALVMGNKRSREITTILVKDLDLELMLKPKHKALELAKHRDDFIVGYPYITTSDTLQRILFFSLAMESNKDSTLIFEEPESFAFPYYTKYLGERIAFDDSNQYFISTHNPYLLYAILEKTPKDSVYVFITYLEDYQTKLRRLKEEEIPLFLDSDPFFNLDRFLEEDEE